VLLLKELVSATPVVPSADETGLDPAEHGARILRVKPGVEMPQLDDAPLFIRWFYDDCIAGPMNSFNADGTSKCRRFIVLGNPGSELTVNTTKRRHPIGSLCDSAAAIACRLCSWEDLFWQLWHARSAAPTTGAHRGVRGRQDQARVDVQG